MKSFLQHLCYVDLICLLSHQAMILGQMALDLQKKERVELKLNATTELRLTYKGTHQRVHQ